MNGVTNKTGTWRVEAVGTKDDENVHVYPIDGREHELSTSCWCRPKPDAEQPLVIVHSHGPS